MTVDEVRVRALELPREERELLGIELLSSLESAETQAEVDAAWAEEILARSEAYRSGKVQALDAAGTVERLRKRLSGHPWMKFEGVWKDHPEFDQFQQNVADYRQSLDVSEMEP